MKEVISLKKFENHQVLKFALTKDKLKMEISLKDLEFIFHTSPNNTYDGETVGVKVKRGKRQAFAEFVVNNLLDEKCQETGMPVWATPFEDVFERILEGYEDFCKYSNDDEEE
jgi:hypothetical protein